MGSRQALPGPPAAVVADVVRRKVAWHVVPLVFVLYIVAYLDRANVGFAKLAMADDLRFSEDVFGSGFGIFFVGYLLLEIPGALLVERWSARKWFTRILISWGLVSALTAFVRTPAQFYVARFLLGVAEAGFFPGVIVYFTHWFTNTDRARALSGFVMAVPFSLTLGAPMSSALLQLHWLGLAGWQWVFIMEGLPAVALGVITFCCLPDRPRDAAWLEPEERTWLETTLAAEAQARRERHGRMSALQVLRQPRVWLLALGIFATNNGGYALAFWLPTTIKSLSGATTGAVLGWSALIYGCGLVSAFVAGQSSDRTGDRKWHCVAGQAGAALFLAGSALPGQSFGFVLVWLCLAGFAAHFWIPPFWSLPTLTLTESAAAIAIGFINVCANIAGGTGNKTVGWLRAHGFGDLTCLLLLAGCYLVGAICIACLKVPAARRQTSTVASP